jgi:hypothetical protein
MDTADPEALLASVAAGLSEGQPYVDPSPAERDVGATGLTRLAGGDLAGAGRLLEPLGFALERGTDAGSGKPFAVAVSETDRTTRRRWGLYLVDLSAPPRLNVAVPHPRSDAGTEELGLRLWRAVPGSVLAMATVHRDAAFGAADHARATGTLFHRLWTAVLGPYGLPQVQPHGFADTTAPEQVAVSTGTGLLTSLAAAVADGIAATDLVTTRGWDGTADVGLRATQNAQGIAATEAGWTWVHVEHNRSVRDDETRWHPAVDAVAAAVATVVG